MMKLTTEWLTNGEITIERRAEIEELSPFLKAQGIMEIKLIPTDYTMYFNFKVVTASGTYLLKVGCLPQLISLPENFAKAYRREDWRLQTYRGPGILQNSVERGSTHTVYQWIDAKKLSDGAILPHLMSWIYAQKEVIDPPDDLNGSLDEMIEREKQGLMYSVSILRKIKFAEAKIIADEMISKFKFKKSDLIRAAAHNDLNRNNLFLKNGELVLIDNEYFGVAFYGEECVGNLRQNDVIQYLEKYKPHFTKRQLATLLFVAFMNHRFKVYDYLKQLAEKQHFKL